MPELDDLLRGDVAGAAARSVRPPDFEVVAARGRRLRRRRRAVVAAAACVLAVVASGGVLLGRATTAGAPAPAGPHPSPHQPQPTPDPAAEQVVDDPAATVTQLAVSPADADVRAVLWQTCSGRCERRHAAIALTADGFESRALVPVRDGRYPWLQPAGGRSFLVTNDGRHPYLLDLDGTRRPVTPPTGPAAVAAGEVVVRWSDAGRAFVAVDPATGASHRVTVPAGTSEVQVEAGGRLDALQDLLPARTPTVAWSDDGGLTWRTHFLGSTPRAIFQLVPSAATGTTAVLVGSDGATMFPFDGVVQGSRAGASWHAFPQPRPPTSAVDGGVVLPDGRLVVALLRPRGGQPGAGEMRGGLYASAARDWSRFTRVAPAGLAAADAARLRETELSLLSTVVSQGRATLYVTEGQQPGGSSRVYAVTDGGSMWTAVRLR